MFCWASIENTNSLPIRRAGSPVQVSAGPSTANFTPAVCSSEAIALVVFLARSSSAPAQPTQNRYSTSGSILPSTTGTSKSSSVDPVRPPGRAHPPRVALVLQVLQHPRRLDRERGLDQHLVPPHPVDVVDVLDVHRALLDARPAVRAGPQHVRVDHPVVFRRTHQRPLGLGLDRVGQLLALLIGGSQQVRRLGERVITQVQDDLLGGQRLAGGPGRALRLAPPALGAGGHVQQALPGEVLDLAQAEHVGVRVGLLEVEHLAVRAHRLERPERVRPPREQDVHRGQEDVQVLGVHHDDQERQRRRRPARGGTPPPARCSPRSPAAPASARRSAEANAPCG